MKKILLLAVLLSGCLAYATPVVMQAGGALNSFGAANVNWATTTVDFNGGSAPGYTGNFAITDCNGNGSTCSPYNWPNEWKAPTGDDTKYITTPSPFGGANTGFTIETVAIPPNSNYFGMYWGSFDTYNQLTLYYSNGTETGSTTFNGTQAAALFGLTPDGNSSGFVNFFAPTGYYFTSIHFDSSLKAFETDNHTFGTTPEPASMLLLGTGLLGAGFVRRLRKK